MIRLPGRVFHCWMNASNSGVNISAAGVTACSVVAIPVLENAGRQADFHPIFFRVAGVGKIEVQNMLGDAVLRGLARHDPVCGIDDGVGALQPGQDLGRGAGRSSGRGRQHHLQQADDCRE